MGRCRFEQMLALDSESAGAWTGVGVAPTSGAFAVAAGVYLARLNYPGGRQRRWAQRLGRRRSSPATRQTRRLVLVK